MSNLASLVYGYEFSESDIDRLSKIFKVIIEAGFTYQIHNKYRPVLLEEWTHVNKKTGEVSNPQIIGHEDAGRYLLVGTNIAVTSDVKDIRPVFGIVNDEAKKDLEELTQILAKNDIPVPNPSVYLVLEKLHQTDSSNS